jgi:peroxiredoxin
MKARVIVSMISAIGVLLAAGAPAAIAQAPAGELGVARGVEAPAIVGTDQSGAPATFASLKGENGLVIAFVRSADWCPFCQKQMQDLNTIEDDLKARGFGLAALSYDSVDKLEKFAKAKKITYTLVSDPESKVIDAFGLRNLEVAGNKRFDGIPHPAIYVIGADGQILDKLYEEKYTKRPPTDLVVKAVDAAVAKAKS